ncbi:ribulose-phosphate 3-epimerase [bacterium]|nr:ribulose-phosphate 3-epimerase [bacterium]
MNNVEISPSILAADFANLEKDIRSVEDVGINSLHLDIMDGHFVPNISFGPVVAASVRKVTKLKLWAHLMIEDPEAYVNPFVDAGVDGIIFHVELDVDHNKIITRIKESNTKCGIAINPDTEINRVVHLLKYIDIVLVMSVYPGFGGQKYIESAERQITGLKKIISSSSFNTKIEVDGGINSRTAVRAVRAGADVLVAGSSVFKHKKGPKTGVEEIRNSIL